MAAAALVVRGGSSRSNGNSSSSGSSSCGSRGGPVIAVSPSHTLEYDCTDCSSFLFGHRSKQQRSRPQQQPQRSGHYHSRGNSTEANAQRLLLIGNSTPFTPVVGSLLPQNEQTAAPEPEGYMNIASETPAMLQQQQEQRLAVSNDVSEPVSVQASEEDDEVEAVAHERVMDFVACHGASPAHNVVAHHADNVSDSSSTLAEIFRCFICLGKVVDAQLCPCCSKLVCQPCIKRWLTDQKSECPHCRAPLLVSQLVSCRFISEISLEVEKIQGKLGDSPIEKYCPAHDSPLLYFCTTCAVAVCSDCAVLIEDHRNHTFEKLSVAYGRHKKKIRMEAAGLRKRRKELSTLVASVDKNIETVLKSKDESAVELQMAFKRMQSRLEEQLKCKLLALLAQKGSMTQEMELLDTILHELDQQLNSIPKSDLIAQEPNMSRMLQDIQTRTFSDISRTPIPAEFTSEVVPSYEHGELVLKNYKETLSQTRPTAVIVPAGGNNANASEDVLLMSKDVVYSEPICASGVTWRLKVYPNGSGASQGTHLSVFLEMVEGGAEAATYEYGIELQHRTRPNQRIVRKFSSDFEEGACWGYYQFFRIDLLEKEGYLQADEDTITLKFYVRPLTYQQQCQDLRRSLAALQAERDESATQVAVIRRAFAATFFQRRRRRSNRGHHATSEQVAFAQAVAAGAGMEMGSSLPSPTTTGGVGKVGSTATSSPIPSMKQLQLKMQEYHQAAAAAARPDKWLPGSCDFDSSPTPIDSFPDIIPPQSVDVNDDEDTEEVSEELVDMRRKSRSHHEMWISKTKNEEYLQTPRRAHKKLRGRKVHKLMLLAPEVVKDDLSQNIAGIATGFIQHFEGLSMVEAGPSSVTSKKSVHSPTPLNTNNKEWLANSSPKNERDEVGCSEDTEEQRDAAAVEATDTVDGMEENKKHPYYSLSMSRNSCCTLEIEDWGNLKNDQLDQPLI